MALLEVRDLKVHFDTEDGTVHALDGISYSVDAGQVLGIVGEAVRDAFDPRKTV